MKKFWAIVITIVSVLSITGLAIYTPHLIEQQQIRDSQVAKYSPKNYYGWAVAYNALQEANDTAYSTYPKKKTEEHERAIQRNYPKKYLPDLIQEFGIVVQKDYSSNYIFLERKGDLANYSSEMMTVMKKAQNSYSDSEKVPNANDANVRVALEKYAVLFEKLNTAIEDLDLNQAQTGALGAYIQKNVGEKAFSDPIAYGQVAQDYLKANLDRYKNTFANRTDDGGLTKDQIEEVETIMWINK